MLERLRAASLRLPLSAAPQSRRAARRRIGLAVRVISVLLAGASAGAAHGQTGVYTGPWGGGTISSGSTTRLDNGASITGNVTSNGTLQFNLSTPLTVTNTINGSGAVTFTNSGTITLTGTNSTAGGGAIGWNLATTVSSGGFVVNLPSPASPGTLGSLAVASSSASGRGSITINGGTVSDANGYLGYANTSSGTATISSGVWSNSGDFAVGQSGAGLLTLSGGTISGATGYIGTNSTGSGTATVSGGSWITSGTLFVGNNSLLSCVLNVNGGSVTDVDGVIARAAGANGAASVTSGTWTNTGNLTVGVGTGTASLSLSGGLVVVGGTFSKGSNGVFTLGSGGTLQIGTGGTTGVFAPTTLTNAGTIVFNRSDASSYTGAISGAGALTKAGSGTLTLSGNNTYSGLTTVSSGSLSVGAGGTTGAIAGNASVASGAVLAFNRSNNLTYSGTVSGAGGLTQAGSGTLTLAGVQSYSGPTTVQAGTLALSGTLASSAVTVQSGATLAGNGFIGSSLTVSGTLSPGNSPGKIEADTVTLLSSATTLMEIVGTASTAGTAGVDYDTVVVDASGGLTYGGALQVSFSNTSPFEDMTTFRLFQFTGSASGLFASVTTSGSGDYAGLILTRNVSDGIWYSGTIPTTKQSLRFDPLTGDLIIVPEPSAWVLIAGLGLAALPLLRRRRARD